MNEEYVYQVIMTNKSTNTVIHVGMFKSEAYAIACMNEIKDVLPDDSQFLSKSIWMHKVSPRQWDMGINMRDDLTHDLK